MKIVDVEISDEEYYAMHEHFASGRAGFPSIEVSREVMLAPDLDELTSHAVPLDSLSEEVTIEIRRAVIAVLDGRVEAWRERPTDAFDEVILSEDGRTTLEWTLRVYDADRD